MSLLTEPSSSLARKEKCRNKGWSAALNITKRRFTTVAAARISHQGACAAISDNAVSCAEPAKTRTVIARLSETVMPTFTIATPVTRPQAMVAGSAEAIARAPVRQATRRGSSAVFHHDKEDKSKASTFTERPVYWY